MTILFFDAPVHTMIVYVKNYEGGSFMNKLNKLLGSVLATVLTTVVVTTTQFTCCFILHQPKMPDEINDFKKL